MQRFARLVVACALSTLVACTGEGMREYNQGSARDVIERGGVPSADSITVEVFLAGHDLPASGPPCDALMCARPALAVAPNLATGHTEYWVHVGMASGLATREFERPPLDMVVLIDKSATMSVAMDQTNSAVVGLIDQLRPDDRLAVLAFDHQVHELQPLTDVNDTSQLSAQVRALRAGGGWDLHTATARAYEMLVAGRKPNRMSRVVLLSGSDPTIDSEHRDRLSQLVLDHARQGIGLSFFGVLLGHDSRVAELLDYALGGAYANVPELARVAHIFDGDIDGMFTPVAYDLSLSFAGAGQFELAAIYGPNGSLDAATTFLGSRHGTFVANLLPPPAAVASRNVGKVGLSYVPEPSLGWSDVVSQQLDISIPDDMAGRQYFESDGVRKAVAIVNLAQQLKTSCAAFHTGDRVRARDLLLDLRGYVAAEADALDDPAVSAELALLDKLMNNMK